MMQVGDGVRLFRLGQIAPEAVAVEIMRIRLDETEFGEEARQESFRIFIAFDHVGVKMGSPRLDRLYHYGFAGDAANTWLVLDGGRQGLASVRAFAEHKENLCLAQLEELDPPGLDSLFQLGHGIVGERGVRRRVVNRSDKVGGGDTPAFDGSPGRSPTAVDRICHHLHLVSRFDAAARHVAYPSQQFGCQRHCRHIERKSPIEHRTGGGLAGGGSLGAAGVKRIRPDRVAVDRRIEPADDLAMDRVGIVRVRLQAGLGERQWRLIRIDPDDQDGVALTMPGQE